MSNEDIQLSTHEQKFAFITLSNQDPILKDGNNILIDQNYAVALQQITKLSVASPITADLIRKSVKTVTEERGLSGVEKNTIEEKLIDHLARTNEKYNSNIGTDISSVSTATPELQTGINRASHA